MSKHVGEKEGPLLLVFGGMHGNEPAGVEAIEIVCKMLEVEHIRNEAFCYSGSFVGIVGNRQAFEQKERFIDRDLNRSWTSENVDRIVQVPASQLGGEDLEIKEILDTVRGLIQELRPSKLIVLDLHTTSSFGGIFSIPTEDQESLAIAKALHAPVIKGMLTGIRGTVLHYFTTDNMGINTTTLAFESGQHQEPKSVNRAVAAVINCMRTIGAIDPTHVEHQHDKILIEYSKALPKVARLVSKYSIPAKSSFKMMPGFTNFQEVREGQALAYSDDEEVYCPADGLILMPLYQKRGEDGFFLVQELMAGKE